MRNLIEDAVDLVTLSMFGVTLYWGAAYFSGAL